MPAIESLSAGASYLALAETLETAFLAWDREPESWPEDRFEAFALEAFAVQFNLNRPYGRYCRAIGAEPASVGAWREIPPAPTAAFRSVDLMVGDPADAALRFRTSGTTRGASSRGVHPILRPATYRAALTGPFRHAVLGGRESTRILLLHPPFQPIAESSLAWMLDHALSRFGAAESGRLDPKGGLPADAVARALESAAADAAQIAILGTTLALAEVADV
ncbi:MAG: hypothetical protein ACE5FP_07155, partial [Gemmatimonadota bacterium]